MTNAKEEFLEEVEGKQVKCASLEHYRHNVYLPIGYTQQQFKEFLFLIDYMYDSGYGGQELYGCIWYQDGTWSERGEYDGSEWWSYQKVPEIPQNLLK